MSLSPAVPFAVTGRTDTTANAVQTTSVRSRSKLRRECARVRTCSVGQPGSRRHGLCGKRPTAHRRGQSQFAQIRHVVRHKTGRWEKPRAASAAGAPETPLPTVLCSHNVLLSYGRCWRTATGRTGRAVTPPALPTAQFEKMGAGKARRTSRAVRWSCAACNVAGHSPEQAAFRVAGLKRQRTLVNSKPPMAIGRRGLCFLGALAAAPGSVKMLAHFL